MIRYSMSCTLTTNPFPNTPRFRTCGEMRGSHARDLDFGRDPEQPGRQTLRLIEVGVSRGVATMRLAHGIDEPVTARKGRERAEVDAGAMRPGRHRAGDRLRIDVALIGERQIGRAHV